MYRIGDEKLNFLLSRGRELIRLQLKNTPDLLGVRAAGNAAGVRRGLLFAVDFQVGLQVVQASEL